MIAEWVGLLWIIGCLGYAGIILVRAHRSPKAVIAPLVAGLVGIPLVHAQRLDKILIKDLGAIEFAKQRAEETIGEIEAIKDRVESQAREIDHVAFEAARALQLSNQSQVDLQNQRDVAHLARLGWTGSIDFGGGVGSGSRYSGWYRDKATNHDFMREVPLGNGRSTFNYDCSPEAVACYRRATSELPDFPISHIVLADCLGRVKDPEATKHLVEAIGILEKIVKVPNHLAQHDDWLSFARKLMESHK